MDLKTLAALLLGSGCTLCAYQGELYVTGGQDTHLHRLGEPPCPSCNCAFGDVGVAETLAAHEPELWELLATDKMCATCYDVDTDTWHPEWVAVDEMGRPYLRWTPVD